LLLDLRNFLCDFLDLFLYLPSRFHLIPLNPQHRLFKRLLQLIICNPILVCLKLMTQTLESTQLFYRGHILPHLRELRADCLD
jgi:hypothetical protein